MVWGINYLAAMSIATAMVTAQAGLSLRNAAGTKFTKMGSLIFGHLCDLLSVVKGYLIDRHNACIYNYLQNVPLKPKLFQCNQTPIHLLP
jgi:hypothetical protein